MDIIFIHLGEKKVPNYLWDAVKQSCKFHSGKIHVLIPKNTNPIPPLEKKVIVDYVDGFLNCEKNEAFKQHSFFKKYGLGDFWEVTIQRYFIIEEYMRKHSLANIIHLEYDNLIYTDLNEFAGLFETLYKDSIATPPVDEIHSGANFLYIDTVTTFDKLNTLIIDLISKGEDEIFQKHNNYGTVICEMKFLRTFHNKYPELVKFLPVLPYYEEYSNNLKCFNSLFDPVSWGRFITGANKPYAGGFIPPGKQTIVAGHVIGEELMNDAFEIIWKLDDEGRKCLFVKDKDNTIWKMNNLHVHSKRLTLFM